jgi:hypothetical protein
MIKAKTAESLISAILILLIVLLLTVAARAVNATTPLRPSDNGGAPSGAASQGLLFRVAPE